MNGVVREAPDQSYFDDLDNGYANVRSEKYGGDLTEHAVEALSSWKTADMVEDEDGVVVSPGRGRAYKVNTVSEGVGAWHEYLRDREHDNVVLESNAGDIMVLDHTHRWSDPYMRKQYAKVSKVEDAVNMIFSGATGDTIPTTMLTLTAEQKDENGNLRSFEAVLDDILDGWNRLRKSLHHLISGRWEFVKFVEQHESGYPHVHVAIYGVARPSLKEDIERLWSEKYDIGNIDASVSGARSRDVESVGGYLWKYIGKALNTENQEVEVGDDPVEQLPDNRGYHVFHALLWITGSRLWSMSGNLRGLVSHLLDSGGTESNTSDKEWTVLGGAQYLRAGVYLADPPQPKSAFMPGGSRVSFDKHIEAIKRLLQWRERGRRNSPPSIDSGLFNALLSDGARARNKRVKSAFGSTIDPVDVV